MSISEIRDVPSALEWIIQNHYSMFPVNRSRFVPVVTNKGTCTEEDYASNANVVTFFEGRMIYWYRPYSEPGSPSIAGWQLSGLFDFLKAVVWQRAIDDWKVERFLLEQNLGPVEQAAVDHYNALKNEGKKLAQSEIERILSGNPSLTRLYNTVCTFDLDGLNQYVEKPDDDVRCIGIDRIRNFIRAMKNGTEDVSRVELSFLSARILHRALEGLPLERRINWRSAEYSQNMGAAMKQFRLLDELSTPWYANQFVSLCLSDSILGLGQKFFFGKWEKDEQSFKQQVVLFAAQVLGSASSVG